MKHFVFLLAPVVLAVACGPTPPNYDVLANHQIEACGRTFTAAEVVRKVYGDEPRLAGLRTLDAVPEGAFQATLEEDGARFFPCAEDADDAKLLLSGAGFTGLETAREAGRFVALSGVDPWGIDGVYTAFRCGFVGKIVHTVTGEATAQGLSGRLAGADAATPVSDEAARDLAAMAFATGMTQVASDGYYSVVDSKVAFLAEETTFTAGPFDAPEGDTLETCGAWIEPRYAGSCDAVRIGAASLTLDRETGEFRQLPLRPLPLPDPVDPEETLYGFQGYCGP